MSATANHPAFAAAFFSSEHKALLCDSQGVILCASDSLIQHCSTIYQDLSGHRLAIESARYGENKPWYQNLPSHHRETRVQGAAIVEGIGELHQLNLISIQPLQMNDTLTGFKIILDEDSLFEQSLPNAAWQQLFAESQVGMCLFDEGLNVLSANRAFRNMTEMADDESVRILDLLCVNDDFQEWLLQTQLLSAEAKLLRKTDNNAFISITPIDLSGRQVFWCSLKDASIVTTQTSRLSESFQRFRKLFDDNINSIALVSPEGFYVDVNRQFTELLQYSREDIINRHFTWFNAPGSFELPDSEAQTFVRSGFSRPFHKKLTRKDGSTIEVSVQLFPNIDASGVYCGAWNFIQPLDQHKKSIIDSERYYKNLFSQSQDALVLTDLDGQIKLANPAFSELVGLDIEALQNMMLPELTRPDDAELEANIHIPALLRDGHTDLYEKRLRSKTGIEIPVSVRSSLITDHQNKPEAVWTVMRDATVQRRLIESLANAERRFRSLFSNSIDAIAFWTRHDELRYANKAYLNLVGYSQEELRHLTFRELTPPGWEDADAQMIEQVDKNGYSDIIEKEVWRKDGQRIPITIRASAMIDDNNEIIGSWVIIRDISELKDTLRRLQHSENLLQQTSRMSRVGGWELDTRNQFFHLTDETFQLLSIPRSYHTSVKNIAKLFDLDSESSAVKMVNDVYRTGTAQTLELKLAGFSPERWVRVSAQQGYEEQGTPYVYGAMQDISDFIQQQRSLESARDIYQQMAFHDPLTQLPNRLLIEDRFRQISYQAQRNDHLVALFVIDLDDFKAINDQYGHPAGDALLISLSERLQQTIRSSDTVARLGGDEFIVIAMMTGPDQAQTLAQKIVSSVQQPMHWEGKALTSDCSIGVALLSELDESFEQLYARADQALYEVKDHGKGTFRLAADPEGQTNQPSDS